MNLGVRVVVIVISMAVTVVEVELLKSKQGLLDSLLSDVRSWNVAALG